MHCIRSDYVIDWLRFHSKQAVKPSTHIVCQRVIYLLLCVGRQKIVGERFGMLNIRAHLAPSKIPCVIPIDSVLNKFDTLILSHDYGVVTENGDIWTQQRAQN